MSPKRLSEEDQLKVRQRANFLCEYCHTAEQWQTVRFTIDHVIPISLGGTDRSSNLALACFTCNRQKSNKIKASDPLSGNEVSIFNPRQEVWSDHFIWSKDRLQIIGRTAIGRATVAVLNLNRERIIMIRSADLQVNRHPPQSDPIQTSE